MLFSLLQVLKGIWKNFGLKKFIKDSAKKNLIQKILSYFSKILMKKI